MKQRHKLYFYHLLTQWWPDSNLLQPIKRKLLGWCGLKIGSGAWIASNVIIRGDGRIEIGENTVVQHEVVVDCYGGGRLSIGRNVFVAEGAYLVAEGCLSIGDRSQVCNRTLVQAMGCKARIEIGANVMVAHGCNIKTTTHEIDALNECIAGPHRHDDIYIKDGCWICAGCIIIPGVVIGRKNVVAAGCVVTKSSPDFALLAGVPGVVKKIYKPTSKLDVSERI